MSRSPAWFKDWLERRLEQSRRETAHLTIDELHVQTRRELCDAIVELERKGFTEAAELLGELLHDLDSLMGSGPS